MICFEVSLRGWGVVVKMRWRVKGRVGRHCAGGRNELLAALQEARKRVRGIIVEVVCYLAARPLGIDSS